MWGKQVDTEAYKMLEQQYKVLQIRILLISLPYISSQSTQLCIEANWEPSEWWGSISCLISNVLVEGRFRLGNVAIIKTFAWLSNNWVLASQHVLNCLQPWLHFNGLSCFHKHGLECIFCTCSKQVSSQCDAWHELSPSLILPDVYTAKKLRYCS